MIKKNNSNPLKLINYYKLINHNLIYNNLAINRYKKSSFEISADKAKNLEKLKKSINNIKNCSLKNSLMFTKRASLEEFWFSIITHPMQSRQTMCVFQIVFVRILKSN